MEERDWYLKEVQKLAKLLAKLTGFKDKGEVKPAFELLDELYLGMLGMDQAQLARLEDKELVQLLKNKALKPVALNALAELFIQEGELLADQHDTAKSQTQFRRAIVVFDYLSVLERLYSFEREAKIKRLKQLLE